MINDSSVYGIMKGRETESQAKDFSGHGYKDQFAPFVGNWNFITLGLNVRKSPSWAPH